MQCPDDEVLGQYTHDHLPDEEAEECRRHLAHCDGCRQRQRAVAQRSGDFPSGADTPVGSGPSVLGSDTDDLSTGPARTPLTLPRGTSVGRFLVLEKLGQGGMGEVYAAFDPQLNRRVALKLLLPPRDAGAEEGTTAAAKERLLREAQAMAQLSHPNVVPVFDAGEHEGRVFIAMELVEGQTLHRWLKEDAARPWRRVLAAFLDAGRGLEAAHRAGLIHRDFKPDNVLVSRQGRIYVMDFGLARAGDALAQPDPAPSADAELPSSVEGPGTALSAPLSTATPSSGLLHVRLTRARGAAGTPGFMPPEQIRGEALDVRADVFAFCASLYLALYGVRPFAGHDAHSVLAATLQGSVRPAPKGARVPAWLHRAVLKGLATDRDQRFAGMDALLAALQDDPAVRRRGWLAAAAVLLVTGAGWAGHGWTVERKVSACRAGGAALAADWTARQGAVERAFLATGAPFAPHAWRGLKAALDRYTDRLRDVSEERCLAVRVRAEAPEHVLPLHTACLTQRQVELTALLDVLVVADAEVVERAPQAAQDLPSPAPCADAAWLARQGVLPATPEAAERLRGLRASLSQAKALHRLGRYQDAIAAVLPVVEGARALPDVPLEGEALLQLGASQHSFGKSAEAEKQLRAAVQRGLRSGHDVVTAQAAAALVHTLASSAERAAEAQLWFEWGMGITERAPEEHVRVRARLQGVWGYLQMRNHAYAQAEQARRQALTLVQQAYGPDSPELAKSAIQLAEALSWQQKSEEAEALLLQAHATLERTLGPEHPQMSHLLDVLGTHYALRGRHQEALEYHRRAVHIGERTLHPTAFRLGVLYNNLAADLSGLDRHAEAAEVLQRALAVQESASAPPYGSIVGILVNLSAEHVDLGDLARARHFAERALVLATTKLPGNAHVLREASLAQGMVDVEQGRFREAIPRLARILQQEQGAADPGGMFASARFHLARALWATGQRRHEVPALAAAARSAFVAASRDDMVGKLDAWARTVRLALPPATATAP